jgi:hypothetical protein
LSHSFTESQLRRFPSACTTPLVSGTPELQLCKFGALCQRRVCFFAHSEEELRPASEGSQAQALSQREELLAVLRQDPAMAREIQKYDFEDVPTALPADPQVSSKFFPPCTVVPVV